MRKMVLALMFIVVFNASLCRAAQDNIFSNPTFGFTVTKPSSWHVSSAEEFSQNMERMRYEDEEFQALAQKHAQVPFVAFMKYPEPYPDVNPSFKVNIKPLGDFQGKDIKEVFNVMLPVFKQAFRDFVIVDGPRDEQIGGHSAAYMSIHYTMVVAEGGSYPVNSEIWLVPRGNYFFMIGVGRSQDADTDDITDINSIIESIRIEY